ncbi:MAG: thiol:disulfide interchange protein [Robiginitomaculum sp.]|nr:MAG: thiol:disulfide interchange protein [Robiginitomaculum sp.]
MKFIVSALSFIILVLMGNVHAHAAESDPIKSGRITAQLVTTYDNVMPGDDLHIALSLRMEKHWHTYWRNAGGPGAPAHIYWEVPEALTVGPIVWPLPIIVRTGPIVNYAFEDELLLPMDLRISKDAKIGDILIINAVADYLVCYEICLPETAKLSLALVVGERVEDARWNANIKRALNTSPKTDTGFSASARLDNGKLVLDIKADALTKGQYKNPYFFPYVQDLINADDVQTVSQGSKGLRLSITPDWILDEGIKTPIAGVIAYDVKTDRGWERRGTIITAITNVKLDIGVMSDTLNTAQTTSSLSLGFAILSAFLGGLILNLMPCVFPILSLKALGFAKTAHADMSQIRTQGWFYTIGVLVSFMALATTLLVLKASGAAIGWGFQLQNPIMVAGLALLFFIIALNLFGYFEIGGKWQNIGNDTAQASGKKGAFFTGVLAVIVATPCTAPFMAGALGFALAQPAFISLIVFFALGLGFALPFLALSYAPKLLQRLPKPGPWMETFKHGLAFPMLLAAIWLMWVLSGVGDENAIIITLIIALALCFSIWCFKRKTMVAKLFAALGIITSIYLLANLSSPKTSKTLQDAWSPERVTELRAAGHNVFVDFTARWCVTCKVNEKLVLHTKATQDLFATTNTKVLIADWTRKDARIANELAKHGRSGVPLYLLYSSNTETTSPQILPQTLTYKILAQALENAQNE